MASWARPVLCCPVSERDSDVGDLRVVSVGGASPTRHCAVFCGMGINAPRPDLVFCLSRLADGCRRLVTTQHSVAYHARCHECPVGFVTISGRARRHVFTLRGTFCLQGADAPFCCEGPKTGRGLKFQPTLQCPSLFKDACGLSTG